MDNFDLDKKIFTINQFLRYFGRKINPILTPIVLVILLNLYLTTVHLYRYKCHINLDTLINELEFIDTICPAFDRVSINYTI